MTSEPWHLDKKVPLGIIAAIIMQTIALVVVGTSWKSDVDHRLDSLEATRSVTSPQGDRITILEQQFSFIQRTLDRIEKKIDAPGAP